MIDICSQSRSLGFSETPIAAHTYALDAQELRIRGRGCRRSVEARSIDANATDDNRTQLRTKLNMDL